MNVLVLYADDWRYNTLGCAGNPLQYLPQPESMKLCQDVTIPVPPNATDESFRRLPPFIANEKSEGRVRWHWRFDLQADPAEENDLIADPAEEKRLSEMRRRFSELKAAAMNSGPLSLRMNSGAVPRSATAASRMRITSALSMRRSTSSATLSRLNSSQIGSHFSRRPSSVWSKTKS